MEATAVPPFNAKPQDKDAQRVLAEVLAGAKGSKAPTEYRLLSSNDLKALPPMGWLVQGLLPLTGLAATIGPSGSGKTFLQLDLCAAIAAGFDWFGHRVRAAPVVYVALEGEAGIRSRVVAWETYHGEPLPEDFHLVLQSFKLTEPDDVKGLAAAAPAGSLIVIDTLNRATPESDENSSRDMGEILEALKLLQALNNGLVLVVHHTGKDLSKGMRGHSSLFAALDAVIEVANDSGRRDWRVTKSKDGRDGDTKAFRLEVQEVGIDEYGDPISSCVVVPDESIEQVKRVQLPRGGNQKLVLDGLKPLFLAGRFGIPGAPSSRPSIELEAAVSAGAARLTCETFRRNTRSREAITGLIARGVLGSNEGWIWLA